MLTPFRSASGRIVVCFFLLATLTCVALSQSSGQAQPQPNSTGTATISGTVKLGEAPAIGITLALMPDQGGRPGPAQAPGGQQQKMPQATTDEKGLYTFTNVAAGRFRVTLLSETLAPANGDTRSTGVAVTVSEGQVISKVDFAMAPGGVITGRVINYQNRPVIAERINLMTIGATGQPQQFNGGSRFSYETDDRGVYRIYGLPAGRYIVSAGTGDNAGNRPGANRRILYPRTFYPDATDVAQAQLVEVSSGGVAEGIDIKMGAPLKTYAVTGHAVDAETGQPLPGVPINVGAQRGGPQGRGGGPAPGGTASSGTSDDKGEFRVTGLLPGKYSISVRPLGVQSEDNAVASSDFYNDPANFEISSDDASGVEVKVHRGAIISGKVVMEGVTDPALAAAVSQVMISAISRGGQQGQQGRGQQGAGTGRQSTAQVSPNGDFTISGLAPGNVRLNVNSFGGGGGGGRGGGGISLIRIERNGAAINGDFAVASGEQVTGVRVVVGIGTGAIQGRVVITGGVLPAGTRLTVTARSLNSSGGAGGQNRPAQVDATGNFRIDGLLSGSYEVRINAMVVGGGFGAGQGAGGGQGRGGGQRGGGGAGGNRTQVRIPDVRQTVNVTNGAEAAVTLNVDLSQQ